MRIGDQTSTNARYIVTVPDSDLDLLIGDKIYFFPDGSVDNFRTDSLVFPDKDSIVEFEIDRRWINLRIREYEKDIQYLQEVLDELKTL